MPGYHKPYTRKEIERLRALISQGLPWPLLEERFGRRRIDMQVALRKDRQGRLRFRADATARRLCEAIAHFKAGGEVAQLAAQWNLRTNSVYAFLLWHGLYHEVREELRQEGCKERGPAPLTHNASSNTITHAANAAQPQESPPNA